MGSLPSKKYSDARAELQTELLKNCMDSASIKKAKKIAKKYMSSNFKNCGS